jgi:two-component system, chemotaxis family, chemotaxis protein CheY
MDKRVLVVDDSLLMRRMIAEALSNDGWQVAGEAADGRAASEQYRQLRPDAVTLDIVMPGVDGLEALQNILDFDPDAKVVIVSALSQTKMISAAIRKGAQDFIAKPFMPEQLQQTMRGCVEDVLAQSA